MCVCTYIYIYMYTHHIVFIYSSVYRHLGCFHVLAIVNSAAMNIEVHVYTMEYYSVIKRNEIMLFAAVWVNTEIIIISEVSQRKANII